MIRKLLLGFAVVLVLVVAAYVRLRHATVPLETAYSGSRAVAVYSTSAQVREQITTVSFGERLEVLQRFQDQVKVRTPDGIVGWVAERDLLSADLWQRLKDLETKSEGMPVEARGHTRVLSNLHFGPGRDTTRVRQLNKDVPLDLLTRQPAEIKPQRQQRMQSKNPRGHHLKGRKRIGGSFARTRLIKAPWPVGC